MTKQKKANFIPHSYQQLAIDKILEQRSSGLFLDMGLGKTGITLSAINSLIYERFEIDKVLVIAPLETAKNTWTNERDKWEEFKNLRISLVIGTEKERTRALDKDADIYVINRENIIWLCDYLQFSWPFDMVVIDELSSFKSSASKRFKCLRKVIPLAKKVVGLTGTPAPNGYMDLWAEIYLLDRGERLCQTITAYRNLYFYPAWGSGHVVYKWNMKDGAKECIDKKLSDLCVSMSAVDYLEMPDRVETDMFVEMDKKERDIYETFGRNHVIPDKDIYGANAAIVQGKLLQMANGFVYDENKSPYHIHSKKLEALEELVEASQGRPLLVFYSFVADKEKILERFPDACLIGDDDYLERWNKGEIKMLLAHPASAGHGLNLQEGGNTVIWYGLPWSLELYQQANARLYRQGQKEHTVYVYHILTKDTHDIDVLFAIKQKQTTQDALLKALKARIKQWDM